ncbi:hypothetical protein QMZ93_07370 [Pantoea stewartii subsp. indologenes]|uniref:hypothetical protein n=1 Tax=Pantoea stewartii TaxID=66269 RepID=UPI0024DFA57C|nr:hypothetical protein [Pantoea stewartii]MDK2633162.1 hypothetical protein [Pantoea stewartii subsp. indologenes]
MAELKAGGIAIFIAGPAELLGLQVDTVRYVIPGESITLPTGFRMRNAGKGRWLIYNERIFVTLSNGKVLDDYCLCPAHWLMPIDGDDFQNEDERHKELTHG